MPVRTVAASVVAAAVAVYVLHEGASVIAPIFLSILLAYATEPLVTLLMRTHVPRVAAAMLSLMILAVLIGSLGRATVRQGNAFIDDLPDAIGEARRMWSAHRGTQTSTVDRVQEAVNEIDRTFDAATAHAQGGGAHVELIARRFDVRQYLRSWGTSAARAGWRALLVAVLTFLMLCAGDMYKRKVVAIGGTRFAERRVTLEVLHAIDRQIERYLLVRLLISAIVGVATGVGLWFVGVAHAFAWGVIAGALNVVPFVGPTIAVALITGAALLQFKAAEPTLLACAVSAAIAALEGNLITPALTSRAGEINTVTVFISVLFFGWLWGVWGLILAIPIVVALKAAADHIEPLQPLGELLGR